MNNATTSASPRLFDEFFEMGLTETSSPFLKPLARRWGYHLPLRAAIVAAIMLAMAFALSWSPALVPISHVLLVFVYFLAGIPALIESLEDLALFDVNIDVLMTLAAFGSILIGSGMEGALLLVLFAISGAMEEAVTAKAKGAISSLHRLTPTRACVVQSDGNVIERALADITVNTTILVKAGQIVPLDGIVIAGSSTVDTAHLTGESIPVLKQQNDHVAAGSRTIDGALTLTVTHTSSDSTLARIIDLVTQAQESKPQLQQWFDRYSRIYALSIIGISLLTAVSFPWLLQMPFLGYEGSLYRALAFLIAASPCALIIAIPIAYLSAISACARVGILLKGGLALEALASCQAIAFDKTGTLTTGELTCRGISSFGETKIALPQALSIACALERGAVHPIAKAILNYGKSQNTEPSTISDFRIIPGHGVVGTVLIDGQPKSARLGSPSFIAEQLSAEQAKQLHSQVTHLHEAGELVATLSIDGELFMLRFADTLRKDIKESLMPLQVEHSLELLMLTGDHQANAKKIADSVGITTYYADLKPEDKLRHISTLAETRHLAMIGDGINDAPALARATVGICMGKVGSATAAEAADIVLLHDNIERLNWLLHKAHLTRRIVRENLTIAIVAMVCASTAALAGIVPLWLAVVLHEGGTVLVGLNGLRLLRR